MHECLRALIAACNPEHITMETYHPKIQPVGMEKYPKITRFLDVACGFSLLAGFSN